MTDTALGAWERFLRSCNTAGGHIILLIVMFCLLPVIGCTSNDVDDYRKAIFGALLLAMNSTRAGSSNSQANGQANGPASGYLNGQTNVHATK